MFDVFVFLNIYFGIKGVRKMPHSNKKTLLLRFIFVKCLFILRGMIRCYNVVEV